jgi:hypothetical protein
LIVALLIGAAALGSHAAEPSWRAMPTASRNILFSVDEASLTRQGDLVKFWERLVYVVPELRDDVTGKPIVEKRVHRIIDCVKQQQGHLQGMLLSEGGRVLEQVVLEPAQVKFSPIPAGSLAMMELEWACQPR